MLNYFLKPYAILAVIMYLFSATLGWFTAGALTELYPILINSYNSIDPYTAAGIIFTLLVHYCGFVAYNIWCRAEGMALNRFDMFYD